MRTPPRRPPSPHGQSANVRPDELERRLQAHLDALGSAPRAELLHVLMLPDFERADRIGEFWGYPESRAFAEPLIDCEEDRVFRAVLVGMLGRRTANLGPSPPPHGEPIVWRSNRRLRAPGLPLYLPKGRRPGGTCFEFVQHPCDERVHAGPSHGLERPVEGGSDLLNAPA
jgi:hypothetical protein